MKLDLTKPVQTRDGRKVRILCTDADTTCDGTPQPIVGIVEGLSTNEWCLNGSFFPSGRQDDLDLVNVPTKRTMWVNCYSDACDTCGHNSRAEADDSSYGERIACVEVEYTEGQGL